VHEPCCRVGEAIGSVKISKKLPLATLRRSLRYLLDPNVDSFTYSKGWGKVYRNIENKDGVVCHGFLLDDKMLFFKPKHTFRDVEIVRNKHQEESTDC